jgi:hypothetical protein
MWVLRVLWVWFSPSLFCARPSIFLARISPETNPQNPQNPHLTGRGITLRGAKLARAAGAFRLGGIGAGAFTERRAA